jgi:hypothetical protein
MSKKKKKEQELNHIITNSIKVGDIYAKIASKKRSVAPARVANQAYNNAIRAIAGLFILKAIK